jgi:hypothetical protein
MTDDTELPEQDSEDDTKDAFLGFLVEDRHPLLVFKEAVRKLVGRTTSTPEQIYHLAKLLLALDRFPRPTTGFTLELSLGQDDANGEMSCQELHMNESSFRVGRVAWIIIDPSMGGDSKSDNVLEVEVGGYRELLHPTAFSDWAEEFALRVDDPNQTLEISDLESESEIDWDAERDDSDWEKLGSDNA